MAFSLSNIKTFGVTWWPGGTQPGPGQYGNIAMALIIQGPENPAMQMQASVQYYLPEETPALSYLEAYQQAYQHLFNSLNLTPDQADQYEQWNQRIIPEINQMCEAAGYSAPDLNGNDWSSTAPLFSDYPNLGAGSGQFSINLGFTGKIEGGSGF